ncbi:InlB B-repeat-containing protein [Kurthia sibirica]|nr:InlB B-repeat-containing protein [Kurthia sibirica]GEK33996.1 hypothetical protein KSI01_15290 [Kurthia sibirica]
MIGQKKNIVQKLLFSTSLLAGLGFFAVSDAQASTETVHDSAELKSFVENSTEDMTLILASEYDQTAALTLSKTSSFNIEIDGSKSEIGQRITLASNPAGTFTFNNMDFNGGAVTRNAGITINGSEGEVFINNSKFENASGTAIISSGAGAKVTVDNTLIRGNKSASGGAIKLNDNSTRNFTIKNSSVVNNLNDSSGYYGGAMSSKQYNGVFTIENTHFKGNKATGAGAVSAGGGAIYMYSNGANSKLAIKNSYFESNETNLDVFDVQTIDGGAIVVRNHVSDATISIDGTTFYDNKAGDDGGAILFESLGINKNTSITNSTFYKNIAKGQGNDEGTSGGAIQMYGNRVGFSGGTELQSLNNTFYGNGALAKRPNQIQKGGALTTSGFTRLGNYTNNLLLGNFVEKDGVIDLKSLSKNTSVNSSSKRLDTLGFDNGMTGVSEMLNTPQQAYGTVPVVFGANKGKIKAGYSGDEVVIPTLPIIPKFVDADDEVIAGIANETGGDGQEFDQRGYARLGKKDVGAVEIASTIYDANGGQFNLPKLEEYTGTTYYEGTTPTQYASVGTPGYMSTIINGKTELNPSYERHTFLGWSKDKKAKLPDAALKTGAKMIVDDQEKVYAVWKEEKMVVKYYGNGNTTGIEPVQAAVSYDKEITIKDKATLKKKGYTFIGWSTKATTIKPDEKLAPGKKVKITKKTGYYAVWKRN